jgi:hypothetical protein
MINATRIRALDKAIPFTLSREEFLQLVQSTCAYCGEVASNFRSSKANPKGIRCNGIDRVDSSGGYTPNNTVPCCKRCNVAKNNMPRDDFLAWIKRVATHQKLFV